MITSRSLVSSFLLSGVALLLAFGCGSDDDDQGNGGDGGNGAEGNDTDAGGNGGTGNDGNGNDTDASANPDASTNPDASANNGDASSNDGDGGNNPNGNDAGGDAGDGGVVYHYNCGAFDEAVGWTVREGYRAVVVADADDGLLQPVALTFAEGGYGGKLFVVNAGDASLRRVDVATGVVENVTSGEAWGANTPPGLLTTITWDAQGAVDGALYVGDQGGDGDADSKIYRVAPDGSATVFASAPGAGLDDIYALTFAPTGGDYDQGLYVSGDTDGGGIDWGRIDAAGMPHDFTDMPGVEGAEGSAFDPTGAFGGSLWVSRPLGGGYAGDGSITPINADGTVGTPIATGLGGVHAVTFSERGAFGVKMYAATWDTGKLLDIATDGTVTDLASGLQLTNYDGNILAVSSDGQVMFVADRLANRIICIEPTP